MFWNQVFLVSCRSTCHRFLIIINYLFGFFSVCFPPGFAFGCKPVWLFTIQDHFTFLNSRLDALSLQSHELWKCLLASTLFNILTKRSDFATPSAALPLFDLSFLMDLRPRVMPLASAFSTTTSFFSSGVCISPSLPSTFLVCGLFFSFRISLRWPIHIINPVDKTKLSCNTPTDAALQFL